MTELSAFAQQTKDKQQRFAENIEQKQQSLTMQANGADEAKQLEIAYREKINQLRYQTIDKVTDVKTLLGKKISLRPDYNKTLTLWDIKTNALTNNQKSKRFDITKDDVLEVVKAKKEKLTLMFGEDKVLILQKHFRDLMLVEVRDELLQLEAESEAKIKEAVLRQRKKTEEYAAQQKAREEAERRQKALANYQAVVAKLAQRELGPIEVEIERAYDGTMPYWKWIDGKGSSKLDTYRDEKFLLNPYRFTEKLVSMEKDTFGIADWKSFVNLRTGEVFDTQGNSDFSMSMWESVTYLANLASQPKYEYNGTMSLQLALGSTETPYRERIFEGMKGEKVFFLDDFSYDVIVGFQEYPHNVEQHTVLYFEKRGMEPDWSSKCISVKWYEQLQKMVGKKALESSSFPYLGDNNLWKEDLQNMELLDILSIKVKDHSLIATLRGRTKEIDVDAINKCGMLAYPFNFAEEIEWRRTTGNNHMFSYNCGYISYEAVEATLPTKPASLKKEEEAQRAHWAELSKRHKALKNHELIGTSLDKFLRDYPSARLLSTTTNGIVTIKVYEYWDYQLVFQNGRCTAQRTF